MASIFSLDKQVASLPKHGFPMSEPFDFTSSCGHLLPVYFDQLNPGEKFRYSCELFTRTQPLAAPANVDIDEYIDVFFVPLKKISSAADNILFQISDLPSSSLPAVNTDIVLPLLDMSKIGVDIIGGTPNTYLGSYGTPVTLYGAYGSYFEDYISGAMRLFDHLQYNPYTLFADQTGVPAPYRPMVNPDAFAVYQAIYYDYFRLSSWENNVIFAYNLDAGYTSMDLLTSGLPWAGGYNLRYLFQLHYRAREKDYFTNVYPSPLIASTGLLTNAIDNLRNVNNWLVQSFMYPVDENGAGSLIGAGTTLASSAGLTYDEARMNRNLSTANLRTLFAVDKLLKVTSRAGKHYDDQVLAHFGFKVPKGYSNEVVHLGVHHQQIHIGEVISTADTNTGSLGELAGKGYGKQSGLVVDNFVAPCHGYVMAIYSCVPRVSYIAGLDKMHTMTKRFDWFVPELDNLGMQPMFEFEADPLFVTPTQRTGWQIRYAQMKSKYPRATHAFKSVAQTTGQITQDGPFAEWNITDPFQMGSLSNHNAQLGLLLVSPCLINEVMLSAYIPTHAGANFYDMNNKPLPEVLYSSDPLVHNLKQNVSKISGMSIYGLDDKAI